MQTAELGSHLLCVHSCLSLSVILLIILDQVEVKYKNDGSYLHNHGSGSSPLVVHGNGPIKVSFSSYEHGGTRQHYYLMSFIYSFALKIKKHIN